MTQSQARQSNIGLEETQDSGKCTYATAAVKGEEASQKQVGKECQRFFEQQGVLRAQAAQARNTPKEALQPVSPVTRQP